MKRSSAALLAGTAVAAVTAVAPPAAAGGACIMPGRALAEERTSLVRIDRTCWLPGAALVATGSTVEFRNPGNGMEHNLSGPGIGWTELRAGESHKVTFGRPGYYPYQCTIHPGMAGVVIVRDLPAAPADTANHAAPAAPASSGDGGGAALPWAAAGVLVAVVGAGAFARRARGVPVPAR